MIADALYAAYAQKPGSQHMASLHACRGLEALVRQCRPNRVLELGSGIGTLTDLLLQTIPSSAVLVTLEDHPYCLEQLRVNLGPRLTRATLVRDLRAVERESFDLVVVDGGRADASVIPFVAYRGLVFVEGFRRDQRRFLQTSNRSCAYMNSRAMHRGGTPIGPNAWGGAYWVYRFEPTLFEQVHFPARHTWDSLLVTKRRVLNEVLAQITLYKLGVSPRR